MNPKYAGRVVQASRFVGTTLPLTMAPLDTCIRRGREIVEMPNKASRFGGIIASGPHYASILLARVATHFSRGTSMVGLEFSLKFHVPARPGDALRFRWEVIDVAWNEKLKGDIVSLVGSVRNAEGTELLTSRGKVLVSEDL